MKNTSIYILIFTFLYFTGFVNGQVVLKQTFRGNDSIPKFVKFDIKSAYHESQKHEVLNKYLKLAKNDSLANLGKSQNVDLQYVLYQQFYKGVKVEFGKYGVHIKEQKVKSINGNFLKIGGLSTKAHISETEALQTALRIIDAQKYMWEIENIDDWLRVEQRNDKATFTPKGVLVIWSDKNNEQYALAYKFDIYAAQPFSRDLIYIDAHSGELLDKKTMLSNSAATGTFATRKSGQRTAITDSYGGKFRLYDPTRGDGISTKNMMTMTDFTVAEEFEDNDNNWTDAEWNNIEKDNAALDAHWALQQTFDYFKNVHRRDSYDNNNAPINCYVHFDKDWANARWDGSRILIGDGNATNYRDPFTSIDMVAHEFAHAFCNLDYEGESGAINEGLSDIWGACVEYYATPEKDIWKIGEDIVTMSSLALRYMYNPNLDFDPDTYEGTHWENPDCGTPNDANDYCGVHTNSGVLNYWFYLLAVGDGNTKTNDKGDCYKVDGIGIDNAAKIVYKMEIEYLNTNANSNFEDARVYAIEAAEEIFGTYSNEVIQTTNAWYAVGVGDEYVGRITGSSTLCNSNTIYTLSYVPTCATTTWGFSPNILYVSGGSENVIVRSGQSGSGWLNVTISPPSGGGDIVITKNLQIGTIKPSISKAFDQICHCSVSVVETGKMYDFYALVGGEYVHAPDANYSWYITPPPSSQGFPYMGSGEEFSFSAMDEGQHKFQVKYKNECGWSDYATKYFYFEGGGFMMQMSPVPANNELNIEIVENETTLNATYDEEVTVELYDKFSKLKKQKKAKKSKFVFNVSDLPPDIYIVRVKKGDKVKTAQIVIE